MAHTHHHGHSHRHHHHHAKHEKSTQAMGRFSGAFFLNVIFALIELIGGVMTNSMAVLSDAFHDLGDAMAIAVAWYLERKSMRGASDQFSYGYRRLSVASALVTGIILLLGSVFVLVKAVPRLIAPETPHLQGMLGLAVLGLSVNGFAAWRVSKGSSLSERMILWHLLEDVMGWMVILIGAIVMMIYPIPILDPIMAIVVALWVLWNVFGNLKETMRVFLQGVPGDVDLARMEARLKSLEHVDSLHHMHLWTMDGESHILTAHILVKPQTAISDLQSLKAKVKQLLHDEFHIEEATLEIEWPSEICADPAH
jgi:cobalt-zinc-cadmium efflux system protein